MIKKMYKKLRYVTCKAKKLLVHPVETFVEEAGKLVPKRHTVAVIKATLVGDLMNEGSRKILETYFYIMLIIILYSKPPYCPLERRRCWCKRR